jgi:hypothetical protein
VGRAAVYFLTQIRLRGAFPFAIRLTSHEPVALLNDRARRICKLVQGTESLGNGTLIGTPGLLLGNCVHRENQSADIEDSHMGFSVPHKAAPRQSAQKGYMVVGRNPLHGV